MTPFEKAGEILEQIEALAAANSFKLPDMRYAQIGNTVIDCEGVRVTLTGTQPSPFNNFDTFGNQLQMMECNPGTQAIYMITIAWECGGVATEQGTDDPDKVARVSAQFDKDHELLDGWARDYEAWQSKEWSIRFTIEGELAVTSMQMTTGVD